MHVRLSYTLDDGRVFEDPESAEKALMTSFNEIKRRLDVEELSWLLAKEIAVLVEEIEVIGQYTKKI